MLESGAPPWFLVSKPPASTTGKLPAASSSRAPTIVPRPHANTPRRHRRRPRAPHPRQMPALVSTNRSQTLMPQCGSGTEIVCLSGGTRMSRAGAGATGASPRRLRQRLQRSRFGSGTEMVCLSGGTRMSRAGADATGASPRRLLQRLQWSHVLEQRC